MRHRECCRVTRLSFRGEAAIKGTKARFHKLRDFNRDLSKVAIFVAYRVSYLSSLAEKWFTRWWTASLSSAFYHVLRLLHIRYLHFLRLLDISISAKGTEDAQCTF